jgi:SAM-dependent methyltransferase
MRWRFFRRRERSIELLQDSLSTVRSAAHFCSTPWSVVREILELAEVGPKDVLYDLGSGDGRIPILAAQEFDCRAVGIELDPDLFLYSARRVVELNLQDSVSFIYGNFFEADLSSASVVVLYLLSAVNGHLRARLASQLRAGSRVVAVDFDVPGWRAERTLSVVSDGNVEYTLYLYRRSSSGALWKDAPTNSASLPASNANTSISKDSPAKNLKGKEDA